VLEEQHEKLQLALDEDYVADDQMDEEAGGELDHDSNREDNFANDYPDEDEYFDDEEEDGAYGGEQAYQSQEEWDLTIPGKKFYKQGEQVETRDLPMDRFLKHQYEEEQAINAYKKNAYKPEYNYFVEEEEEHHRMSDDY